MGRPNWSFTSSRACTALCEKSPKPRASPVAYSSSRGWRPSLPSPSQPTWSTESSQGTLTAALQRSMSCGPSVAFICRPSQSAAHAPGVAPLAPRHKATTPLAPRVATALGDASPNAAAQSTGPSPLDPAQSTARSSGPRRPPRPDPRSSGELAHQSTARRSAPLQRRTRLVAPSLAPRTCTARTPQSDGPPYETPRAALLAPLLAWAPGACSVACSVGGGAIASRPRQSSSCTRTGRPLRRERSAHSAGAKESAPLHSCTLESTDHSPGEASKHRLAHDPPSPELPAQSSSAAPASDATLEVVDGCFAPEKTRRVLRPWRQCTGAQGSAAEAPRQSSTFEARSIGGGALARHLAGPAPAAP
mmetsp:Transcript_57159/g.129507  ORF Transcript_57159/g.129507 Transcript_57159/m.129507 type:complete len:362 (-) Transcript_57159:87-1172(-)